jgi:succinate dehydrogenase / fumarate reductase membrane anchor subunit
MAMSIQTPLGKVRGHGAAHTGTRHFWFQRLTAIALVPLTLWFVWAVVRYVGAPYAEVIAFLGHPVSGVAMLMFVLMALWHMLLGVQMVVEDYVPHEGSKIALLFLLNFVVLAIAITCVVAVLRMVVHS